MGRIRFDSVFEITSPRGWWESIWPGRVLDSFIRKSQLLARICVHIWTFGFGFIYVKVLRCPNHQEQVSTCLVDLLLQLPRTVYCDGVCIHSEPIGSRITRPIDRTFKNARRKSCRFLFAPALSAWTPPTAALSKASESFSHVAEPGLSFIFFPFQVHPHLRNEPGLPFMFFPSACFLERSWGRRGHSSSMSPPLGHASWLICAL